MNLTAGARLDIKMKEYFDKLEKLPLIALPSPVIIKYGGSAMLNEQHRYALYCQLVFLACQGVSFILVHGGGHQITKALRVAGLKAKFHQGLRITDDATMKISEQVLIHQVNPQIVEELNLCCSHYGKNDKTPLGLDSRAILQSEPLNPLLGRVGKVVKVDVTKLTRALKAHPILVLPPIGSQNKQSYNINADWAAASVAIAMKAAKLIYITDEDGILDAKGNRIVTIGPAKLEELQTDGTISSGMIPKTQSIMAAIYKGVKNAQIVNGAKPYFVYRSLKNEEIGTLVVRD